MASMKVIDYIELSVPAGERHLKEMRDAAESLTDNPESIVVYAEPDAPTVVVAEFTMTKARQIDIDDKILHCFALDMPDYENQSIVFPRSEAEERKAQKASERAKAKRKQARESVKQDSGIVQIVFSGSKGELNKAQRAFIKAKEEVERSQKELRERQQKYETILAYHAEVAAPEVQKLNETKLAFIDFACPLFFDSDIKLDKRLRAKFEELVLEHFEDIRNSGYVFETPQIDLHEKIADLHAKDALTTKKKKNRNRDFLGEGFAADEDEFEVLKDLIQDMYFSEFGEEIDLDGLTSDMDERAIRDYVLNKKQQSESSESWEKSADQRMAAERLKSDEKGHGKDMISVYRQLARLFHPDLEQDPQRRIEKEALMKELTAAYDKGDLHTILGLELRWLLNSDGDITKLADTKLAAYTKALKRQSHNTEQEMYSLRKNPRFIELEYLDRTFYLAVSSIKKKVNQKASELREEQQAMQTRVTWLKTILAICDPTQRTNKLRAFAQNELETILENRFLETPWRF